MYKTAFSINTRFIQIPQVFSGVEMWALGFVLLLCTWGGHAEECAARETNSSSIICVCNSTYCDTLPQVEDLSEGTYQYFVSTEDGLRLSKESGNFTDDSSVNLLYVTVDRSQTYQTIKGFGGAFTDAAGFNIAQLSEGAQENLLRAYFSADGAEYTLGRVALAGNDFSVRGYTYADDSNGTLDGFALQDEDYNYKIPYILKANELANGTLDLLASAWSPPGWMKTSGDLTTANSFLKEEYYQLWADYYLKFFEEYAKNNITFWALTTQNEPATGYIGVINSMAWTVEQLITWLTENLGPTIRGSEFADLDILIHDDQTADIALVQEYFNNEAALNYTDGVAVHWYLSFLVPDGILQTAKTDKKDVYLIQTESCTGFLEATGLEKAVELGNWDRAAAYAKQVIDFLNEDAVGWIDWNLVLDEAGGPNWVDNYVDAPIIVNAENDEFYKQPAYFALSHFSKYIPRGSVRVGASASLLALDVATAAFLRPDGAVSVVLHNEGLFSKTLAIYDSDIDGYISVELPATGIATLVYK